MDLVTLSIITPSKLQAGTVFNLRPHSIASAARKLITVYQRLYSSGAPDMLQQTQRWGSVRPATLRSGLMASQTLCARRSSSPCAASAPTTSGQASASTQQAQTAKIIDGKAIAAQIRGEIAGEVVKLKEATGKVPGLAVVLVGARKDSETYVRSKRKACDEVGFASLGTDLPEDATEAEVLSVVQSYNADPKVHGILVQLPLPKHMDEQKVLDAISIEKDVDGFHPTNIGSLAMRGREPLYVSCTPKGCIELLERSGVEFAGKTAVVVGRSNIVGLPVALLLQNRDATVTMVHSRTPDAAAVTARADIVIAACGRAEMLTAEWIKPGAVVIDVGINAKDDSTAKRGYRLVGDVAFEEVSKVAGAITPVPGGVGPMTIAMLLRNTLDGAKRQLGVQ